MDEGNMLRLEACGIRATALFLSINDPHVLCTISAVELVVEKTEIVSRRWLVNGRRSRSMAV